MHHYSTRFIGFLCILVSLAACEGNTRLEWSLDNQSSEDVFVIHKAWDYPWFDSLYVSAGEELVLGQNDVLGGQSQPWAPFSFIDTLFIYSASGDPCTLDWQETESWEIKSEEESRTPSSWKHFYTLTVGDEDF